MKLFMIIKKNFKVLFRSKSSAFVVLVGPLLIIGLIALALSNTEEFRINVGAVTQDMEGMTAQFIDQMEKSDYRVINYNNLDNCLEQIKSNTINLCIEFPPNFVLDNDKTYKVKFHVDQSRLNVVDSIKSSVLSTITVKSDEITMELTTKLIDTINIANEGTVKLAAFLDEMEVSGYEAGKSADIIYEKGNEAADSVSSGIKDNTEILSSIETLNSGTQALLNDLDKMLDSAEGLESKPSKTADVRGHHGNVSSLLKKEVEDIKIASNNLKSSLGDLKSSISSGSGIQAAAETVNKNIVNLQDKIAKGKSIVADIRSSISGIEISSASSIVNPFTIEVHQILSTNNKGALLFPYFLTLVILFVGVMLSSTLVIFEKKSRAFFRTFTTPTSPLSHLFAGYVTNFMVLIVQLFVVFIGAFYYLKLPLLDNLPVTLVILLLSITFFVFLGTMVGYFFKTQEGTTIASISMGSLFLFLSNLILPVETFSATTQKLILINPFMLCSELFKRAMLFGASFGDVKNQLFLLITYILVVMILAVMFQRWSFNRLFTGFANRKILKKPHFTKENCLEMPDGTLLRTRSDLIHALKGMKDSVFNLYVSKENNEFAVWIKEAFNNRKLAKKVRKLRTKEEILVVLKADNILDEGIKPVKQVRRKIVFTRSEPKPVKKHKGVKFKFLIKK